MKKIILVLVVLLSTFISEVHSLNGPSIEKKEIFEPQITSSLYALKSNYAIHLLLNEKQFLLQAKKEELFLVFSLLILSDIVLLLLVFNIFFRKRNIENIQYI